MKRLFSARLFTPAFILLSALLAGGALAQPAITNPECLSTVLGADTTGTDNSQYVFRAIVVPSANQILVNLPGMTTPVAAYIDPFDPANPEAGAPVRIAMAPDPFVTNGWIGTARGGALNGGSGGKPPFGPGRRRHTWSIVARDSGTGGTFMNGINAAPKPAGGVYVVAPACFELMPVDATFLPDKRLIPGQLGNGLRVNPEDPTAANDGSGAHIYTWRVRYRALLGSGQPPAPMYDRSYFPWRDTRYDFGNYRFNNSTVLINGPVILNLVAPDGSTIKCPMEIDPDAPNGGVSFAGTYGTVGAQLINITGGTQWDTGVFFRYRVVPTQYVWNHGPLRGEGPHTAFGGPTMPDQLPAIPIGLGGGADGETAPGVEIIGRPYGTDYVSFAGPDLLNFYPDPFTPTPPPFPFWTTVAGRAGQWRYYYEATTDLRPPTRPGFQPNFQYNRDLWGQDPGAYQAAYDSDNGPLPGDPTTPYGHPFVSPILSDGGWTDDLPQNGYTTSNGPSHRSRVTTRTLVRFICRVTKENDSPLPGNAVRVYIDGVARSMLPLDGTSYTLGKPFYFDTTFPVGQEGQHNIYFEVDDGIHRTIWPRRDFSDARFPDLQGQLLPVLNNPVTFGTGTIGRNYLAEPLVNNKPRLTNPLVTPPSGVIQTSFTYTVTFTDPDNDEPLDGFVYIDGFDDAHAHRMSPVNNNPTSQGRPYTFTLNQGDPLGFGPTADGVHFYYFKFRDNWNRLAQYNISPIRREFGQWATAPAGDEDGNPSTVIRGPIVTTNNPPELLETDVFASDPAHTPATLFDIVVRYRDPENEAPTGIRVYISADGGATYDGGTSLAKAENSNNYASGVQYHLVNRIQLPVGSDYRYRFEATDGTNVTNLIHVGSGSNAIDTGSTRQLSPVTGLPGVYEDPTGTRNWSNANTIWLWRGTAPTAELLIEGVDFTADHVQGRVTITDGNPGGLPIRASYFHSERLMPNIVPNSVPTLTYPDPTTLPVRGSLNPQQGQASPPTTFTYSIIYTDADNQAPAYVNVVIDTNKTVAMAMDPATQQPVDYRRGIRYFVDVAGNDPALGVGQHSFHFETSDNADVVRQPLTTDNPQDLPGPSIADIGGLNTPLIQPFPKGKSDDQYLFTITYRSVQGLAPAFPIELRVLDTAGTSTTIIALSPIDPVGPTEYQNGVRYQASLNGVAVATPTQPLDAGTHGISFGFQNQPDSTAVQNLIVNGKPVLTNANDTPDPVTQAGDIDLSVTYTDINGDQPQRAGIVLKLDGMAYTAVAPVTTPANPTAADYRNGVVYRWRIDASTLAVGSHTYSFSAQDDLEDWTTAPTEPGGTFDVNAAQRPSLDEPGPVDAMTNNGTLTPLAGPVSGQYTYRVVYKHPDFAPPQRIEVVTDPGTANQAIRAMTPVNPAPAAGDPAWGTGVLYQYITQPNQLPAGNHTYRFQAADRVPPDVTLPPSGSYSGPNVNAAPSLQTGIVFEQGTTPGTVNGQNVLDPAVAGTTRTNWVFRVTYKDPDGVAPTALGFVRVVVDGATQITLTPAAGDPLNYVTGVVYESAPTQLSSGQKTFHFEANDGLDSARLPSSGDITGLTVRNILVLEAPGAGTLTPTSGPVSTNFTFEVVYKNLDGTAPSFVKVVIDEGTPQRVERLMSKVGATANFITGETYRVAYRFAANETDTSHTYHFESQDTLTPIIEKLPASGEFPGPTLNIATIDNVVFNPNPGTIGSPITMTGKLNTGGPITTQLSIQLVSPDGAGTNDSATTAADGTFTFNNFLPQQTGDWKVRVSWGGQNGVFDPITQEFNIRVTGISVPLTNGELDLVSIPLVPVTPDPSITFGPVTPGTTTGLPVTVLNVVKWVPAGVTQGQYLLLNADANFPGIAAGNGYWMRPSQAVELAPRGRLADQTQPYAIPLPVGWNTIGSVYLQPINWSAVQVRVNGVVRPISQAGDAVRPVAWGYNKNTGGYTVVSNNDQLTAGKGYWIKVLVPGVELILNPPGTRAATRASDIREGSIQLSATMGSRSDTDTFVPLTGTYKTRIADLEKPPYLQNYVSVRLLPGDGLSLPEGTRAATEAASTIYFEVVTDQKDADVNVQLRNAAELGRKYKLTLVDMMTKQTRAMQTSSGISFNTGQNAAPRRFALVVEREMANTRLIVGALRVTTRSQGSYQFGYDISKGANVRAQIVGLNGQMVREIQGTRAVTRGANTMLWDAKDQRGIAVPAGSYVLKLTASTDTGEQAVQSLQVIVTR